MANENDANANVNVKYNVDSSPLKEAASSAQNLNKILAEQKAVMAAAAASEDVVTKALREQTKAQKDAEKAARDQTAALIAIEGNVNAVKIGLLNLKQSIGDLPPALQNVVGGLVNVTDASADAVGNLTRLKAQGVDMGAGLGSSFANVKDKGAAMVGVIGLAVNVFTASYQATRSVVVGLKDVSKGAIDVDKSVTDMIASLDKSTAALSMQASAFENSSADAAHLTKQMADMDKTLKELGVSTMTDVAAGAAKIQKAMADLREQGMSEKDALKTLGPAIQEWYQELLKVPGATKQAFGETKVLTDQIAVQVAAIGGYGPTGKDAASALLGVVDQHKELKTVAPGTAASLTGVTDAMRGQSEAAKKYSETLAKLSADNRAIAEAEAANIIGLTDEAKQARADDLLDTQNYAKSKTEEMEKLGEYVGESYRKVTDAQYKEGVSTGDAYDRSRKAAERAKQAIRDEGEEADKVTTKKKALADAERDMGKAAEEGASGIDNSADAMKKWSESSRPKTTLPGSTGAGAGIGSLGADLAAMQMLGKGGPDMGISGWRPQNKQDAANLQSALAKYGGNGGPSDADIKAVRKAQRVGGGGGGFAGKGSNIMYHRGVSTTAGGKIGARTGEEKKPTLMSGGEIGSLDSVHSGGVSPGGGGDTGVESYGGSGSGPGIERDAPGGGNVVEAALNMKMAAAQDAGNYKAVEYIGQMLRELVGGSP